MTAGACSRVGFFYNRLQWLAPEYIEQYVALNDAQEALLEKALDDQLRWHRTTQLPQYARLLYRMRDDVGQGLSKARLDDHQHSLMAHWDTLLGRLTPPAAALLMSISDEQVSSLQAAVEKRNKTYAEEYADLAEPALREKLADNVKKRISRWIGDIDAVQARVIDEWSRQYIPMSRDALNFRRQWQSALFALLDKRKLKERPQFSAALGELLLYPEKLRPKIYAEKLARNREIFKALLLRLDKLMSVSQRAYLSKRLASLARDFEKLARD